MTVFVADEQMRPVALERLERLADHVCRAERVPDAMELTVLCVDEDAIAELNAAHLGASGPTDVLAFPMDAPGEVADEVAPALLGDVVVCPEVAERQAPGAGAAELEMLLVHGILHLLGHDHAEPDEERAMEARTDELLAGFRARHGAPPADPTAPDPRP